MITIHHLDVRFEVKGEDDRAAFRRHFAEAIREYEERKLRRRLGEDAGDLGDGTSDAPEERR